MNHELSQEMNAATVVQPEDDLVAVKLPALRRKLRGLAEAGVLNLVLDLSTVKMVDSAGIGLLLSAHNSMKKAGGEFAVTHASSEVLSLLQSMRIHQHFKVSGN